MPTNGGSHDESFTRLQCAEFGHARACAGLLTWKGGFVGTDGNGIMKTPGNFR